MPSFTKMRKNQGKFACIMLVFSFFFLSIRSDMNSKSTNIFKMYHCSQFLEIRHRLKKINCERHNILGKNEIYSATERLAPSDLSFELKLNWVNFNFLDFFLNLIHLLRPLQINPFLTPSRPPALTLQPLNL